MPQMACLRGFHACDRKRTRQSKAKRKIGRQEPFCAYSSDEAKEFAHLQREIRDTSGMSYGKVRIETSQCIHDELKCKIGHMLGTYGRSF